MAHRIIEIPSRLAGSFICSADAVGQEKVDIRARSLGDPLERSCPYRRSREHHRPRAGGAFLREARAQLALAEAVPGDLHLCALALIRARRHRAGHVLCTDYLAPAPLRKSDGDMPASLRNDLLKALSEPKPDSMATRSTLASWCISSAWA